MGIGIKVFYENRAVDSVIYSIEKGIGIMVLRLIQ